MAIFTTFNDNCEVSMSNEFLVKTLYPHINKLLLALFIVANFNISAYSQVPTGWENHNYIKYPTPSQWKKQGYNTQINPERKFSKFAQKGTLSFVYYQLLDMAKNRYAIIDNKTIPLAPSVRFYNDKNQLITPPSAATVPADVAYTTINEGINKLWILNKDEVADFDKYKFK